MEDNAQAAIKNILLCIDGEPKTKRAIRYAIEIARASNGMLTALHVINPYLKKFADEIYAVGRNEYKAHIDKALRKEAEDVINRFKATADLTGISYKVIVRYGPPEEEITKEVTENAYDLLILGARESTTFKAKMGSFNLPGKIFNDLKIPTLFVK
jgi:nucleotide-binding universal stress UspA family protein